MLLGIMHSSLEIIETMHKAGYLHRDVKPSNFMIRLQEGKIINKLYPIDFGISKRYIRYGAHIPFKEGKKMVGSPVFCSPLTHQGHEQSRRDDLWSWLFMSIYLVEKLPWESKTTH